MASTTLGVVGRTLGVACTTLGLAEITLDVADRTLGVACITMGVADRTLGVACFTPYLPSHSPGVERGRVYRRTVRSIEVHLITVPHTAGHLGTLGVHYGILGLTVVLASVHHRAVVF